KVEPLLAQMGRRLVKVGEASEMANLFKIAGNFMIIAALETMGEAFALLRKGGVDAGQFHEVMSSSLFASRVHQGYGGAILSGQFEPAGFEMKLGLKDSDLARTAAKQLGMTMPIADLASGHFTQGIKDGMGEKDWAAIADIIAANAGL
ncbi:MAG TPA: NAD-binding protein, partial [Rhizomicrobium sp.]|nr:NAD-binding protein [Rhizomicrobium sp.]